MTLALEPGPLEVGHEGRCNARTKQTGGRCKKPAGAGTDHLGVGACKLHGGSTPSHEKAAATAILEGSIAELVARHRPGLERVDPHVALLEVVGDTWALRRALWGLVGGLRAVGAHGYEVGREGQTGDGRLVLEWVPADPGAMWGPDHKGDARPHVLVGMLHEATREHLQACKLAIDAGIAQRQIELAEGQAEIIAGVLRAMAAGVLEQLRVLGGDQVLVAGLEGVLPGLMRGALESARPGVLDVHETKET